MSKKLKFAVILGLVSTTALSSYASTNPHSMPQKFSANPNKMDAYKGHMELKSSHPKHQVMDRKWPVVKAGKEYRPFVAKKVFITFDHELENLSAIGQDYVGMMITQEKLAEINAKIADYYIAHDFLLPQVTLDKDAMISGILKLDIKAASISKVVIMGDGEKNTMLQEYAEKITAQSPAMKHQTQRYLGLMNKVPGMEISYELVPGPVAKNGEAEIELVILTSTKKGSVFAGVDNFGPNDLGKYQLSALGEINNPFSDKDAIMLNAATSNHPSRIYDVGGGYSRILNTYGTTMHLFASHGEDNSTSNQSVNTPNGKSNSARLALTQQLILRANHDLQLEVGTQYHTSVQYQVNSATNLSQKYKVSKYTTGDIGLRYLFKDQFNGRNLVHSNLTHGLNGQYRNYQDAQPNLPNSHFSKKTINYFRDQQLGGDFTAFVHLAASHSKNTLPTSQQSIIGGRDFGRGYDFATLEGTKMTAGSLELRYTKEMDKFYVDQVQPYIYGDAGHMNRVQAGTNVSHLESYGAGLRVRFMKNVDLGMEVAQPCKKNFTVGDSVVKAKTRFNMFINKVFEF